MVIASNFFDLGWWLGEAIILCLAAYLLTITIQSIRARVNPTLFRRAWWMSVIVAAVWSGVALIEYLPNALRWHRLILFLPGLLVAVLVAMAKEWMSLKQYCIFVASVALVIIAYSYAIDGSNFEFELSRKLRSVGQIIDRTRGVAGPEGGMARSLGTGFDQLGWYFLKAPGIVLLSALLVVPPRRMPVRVARPRKNLGVRA